MSIHGMWRILLFGNPDEKEHNSSGLILPEQQERSLPMWKSGGTNWGTTEIEIYDISIYISAWQHGFQPSSSRKRSTFMCLWLVSPSISPPMTWPPIRSNCHRRVLVDWQLGQHRHEGWWRHVVSEDLWIVDCLWMSPYWLQLGLQAWMICFGWRLTIDAARCRRGWRTGLWIAVESIDIEAKHKKDDIQIDSPGNLKPAKCVCCWNWSQSISFRVSLEPL